MLDFACPACDHKLKVKDELAGRKGKCPNCGSPLTIPAPSAAVSPAGSGAVKKVPPQASPSEEATAPPADGPAGADGRRDTRGDADATGGARPSDGLTDFLAPPLGPGEIGRLGLYRVLKVLGAGGMGVVFQAEDPGLRRLIALKAMLPGLATSASARERFLREARSAAAVEHDHIVAIYQVGEDRGVPYLAMPFLRGEPLDARLRRERRLPMAEVLRIARETATGLEAARQRGMMHRDIKPANLWLEEGTGRVKILDFGLARCGDDEAHLTQQGAILGTPAYMAPEQAGGKADHRSDLFSLGCVIYRMATGEPAFQGSDAISTLMAVATEPVRPPREVNANVPQALSDLILRLLAKRPEQRPASAQAVVEAIRAIEAQPKPPRPMPAETRRSGPQRLGVAPAPPKPTAASTTDRTATEPEPPPRGRAAGAPRLGVSAQVSVSGKKGRRSAVTCAVWFGTIGLLLASGLGGGYFLLPYLSFNTPAPVPPGPYSNTTQPTPPTPPPTPNPEPGNIGVGGVVAPWLPLFDGKDLVGWTNHKGKLDNWGADKGVLYTNGTDRGWLLTEKRYSDFELRLDYKIAARTNTGVGLRVPPYEGDPSYSGMEIQITDEATKGLKLDETTGSLWGVAAANKPSPKPPGEWNHMVIKAQGRKVTVQLNGVQVLDADLDRYKDQVGLHPGLLNVRGRIGLQSHTNRAEFKEIFVRRLLTDKDDEEKAP